MQSSTYKEHTTVIPAPPDLKVWVVWRWNAWDQNTKAQTPLAATLVPGWAPALELEYEAGDNRLAAERLEEWFCPRCGQGPLVCQEYTDG